jgi:hypothetical protein
MLMLYGLTPKLLVISLDGKWTIASRNLIIHMFVSFIVANLQLVILCFLNSLCVLSLWQKYINYFCTELICFSCMSYALCHVEWWPLRVSSLYIYKIKNIFFL